MSGALSAYLKIFNPASSPMMAATLYASEYFSRRTDMSMKEVALTEKVRCAGQKKNIMMRL